MEGYQIAFEDVQRDNTLATQPGRTAFVDECGNFGFDFQKSDVSTHYVVCAVVVDNSTITNIEHRVAKLQKKFFGQGELKSSSIGDNYSRRAKILTELMLIDFSLIILIADKRSFYKESPLTDYKGTFVKYLHRRLYDSMICVYPKLKIVEDEYGTSDFQRGYRKYVNEHRPRQNLFNEYDFDFVDSKESNIVQIADIVAGSVMKHIIDSDAPDVLKIFQGKIRDIINFPSPFVSYDAGSSADVSCDNAIYSLASKCASDYIERNNESDEEEIRIRILFLRLILFTANNYNQSKFLHSGEIVRELSSLSNRRITRYYLYRKIIAPLRDDGILIASSTRGYKLPTCVDDIYTYINQTITVVGPMLSRIEKCRIQIKKQTDGKLDVLDDPALEKYKRYFGDY